MQNLTTAEIDRLRTLRRRFENASTFTHSSATADSLDAYIERLVAKGRDVEQIIAITTD